MDFIPQDDLIDARAFDFDIPDSFSSSEFPVKTLAAAI
jgi:hypothetical protein